jgi:carboxypeptidase Taq
LRNAFPDALKGLDAEAMYRASNVVKPGANRVNADEMSYHLHIILRYELEVALLAGSLSVRDLPAVWNERSASLIGVTPSSDREGVLQDVHWSLGSFGYFPSYTLGSIYGAQLMETYSRDHALEREIERGEFHNLLEWLRTHVHRVGHRFDAEQIVANATGSALDTEPFFRHLQSKLAAG